MKFQGSVKNGKFCPLEEEKLKKWFKTLENEKIVVSVKKWNKLRTVSQNAYYWFGINLLTDTGYTKEELHESFKIMFLPKTIKLGDREMLSIQSTTELDSKEFIEYIERVKDFAVNTIGIRIPEANEIPIEELEKFYNLS